VQFLEQVSTKLGQKLPIIDRFIAATLDHLKSISFVF